MIKEEKTYMTKKEYDKQLELLKKLKEAHSLLQDKFSKAYSNYKGERTCKNVEVESLLIEERNLIYQINQLAKTIQFAEIIEKEIKDDCADIDDTVNIDLIFAETDSENITFKLVGAEGDITNHEVSINSPLGSNVYGKQAGYSGSYEINKTNIKFTIKNISKSLSKENQNVKKK